MRLLVQSASHTHHMGTSAVTTLLDAVLLLCLPDSLLRGSLPVFISLVSSQVVRPSLRSTCL